MYTTPALADDVADLAAAMSLARINIYGVSYGTRWALEVMRRHPNLVRAAVLDAVYPPQVNGEQNEPEIVRRAFEQLYSDCAADALCRERHPGLRGDVEAAIEAAQGKPVELTLQLEDGPQTVRLDGPKLLMVLLHMMREGEAALLPEAVCGDPAQRHQAAQDLRRGPREQRRRPARAERPAVRRALQQHRMPRDLGRRRPRGAAQADRGERRLWPHRQDQQVAGLLPGVARGAGARRRAPAGQGRDADAAA